jgi:hypothetical protein
VSAYVVTACIEAYYRYPNLLRIIDAALPAEEIGRRARGPGCRANTVHLWGIPNFWLIGRKALALMEPGTDAVEPAYDVLHFWERAALAFRGDGTRQAWDTGSACIYGDAVVDELLAGTAPVDDAERARIKRLNATLIAYLFLLYFDTRVGSSDTGPYALPDGRVLLVRDFYDLDQTDYWWSDVAKEVPYRNLTAALVLDGARITRVSDFGTSTTEPEDYLDHLAAFGLFTTDTSDGSLRPVPLAETDDLIAEVRRAQAAHYRNVAAMSRDEKIRCGAYVYFTFPKPFAEIAGVADRIDWTVPRDIPPPVYDFVSQLEGANAAPAEPPDQYHLPLQ